MINIINKLTKIDPLLWKESQKIERPRTKQPKKWTPNCKSQLLGAVSQSVVMRNMKNLAAKNQAQDDSGGCLRSYYLTSGWLDKCAVIEGSHIHFVGRGLLLFVWLPYMVAQSTGCQVCGLPYTAIRFKLKLQNIQYSQRKIQEI